MNAILFGVLAYVLVQLIIGLVVSRSIKTETDYLLAGRRLGLALATFSIFATWFGAESCVGSAGAIYDEGLSGGANDPFGYTLCLLFMAAVFAVPLYKRKLTTLGDFYRQRFGFRVERLAAIIMIPTSVIWAAAQVRAFGQVLAASSELDLNVAITIGAVVVVIYTAAGGLLADAVTDIVQGSVLIVGLVIVAVMVISGVGGLSSAVQMIETERLSPIAPGAGLWDTLEVWAVPICGSVVAQELISRVLASRSASVARRAAFTATGLYLVVGLIPAFIGLIGPTLAPGLEDSEQLLPVVAQQHLHSFMYIIFAGALISAILSTVDSTLLAAAALTTENIVASLKPGLGSAARLRISRLGVVFFGVMAYVLALNADSILALVEDASSFGSAGIFITLIFGLFTAWGGSRAAACSLLAGVGTWLYGTYMPALEWPVISALDAATHAWPYLCALAAALLGYLVGSLFDRNSAPAAQFNRAA